MDFVTAHLHHRPSGKMYTLLNVYFIFVIYYVNLHYVARVLSLSSFCDELTSANKPVSAESCCQRAMCTACLSACFGTGHQQVGCPDAII